MNFFFVFFVSKRASGIEKDGRCKANTLSVILNVLTHTPNVLSQPCKFESEI